MRVRLGLLQDESVAAQGGVDAYVKRHPRGSFFHLTGWATIAEKVMGQEAPYLLAVAGEDIVGVMPLVLRRSCLFGRAGISGFLGVTGGPVADNEEIERMLLAKAWALVEHAGGESLHIRLEEGQGRGAYGAEWRWVEGRAAVFRRPLAENDAAELVAIPRKARAAVRGGLSRGVTTRDARDNIGEVWRLYAENVRRLGTPVFSRRLFAALPAVFKDAVDMRTVHSAAGEPVASLVSFYFRDRVLPYYAGASRAARACNAHDVMYYDAMCRARACGAKVFDFGRSKVGSGPYKYKKNWGFEPQPLLDAHRLRVGAKLPDLSPQNPKYARLAAMWQHLPGWAANRLGPPIARHLG